MNSWAEISEQHLTANYRAVLHIAGPDLPVLAVIKANAYGHSAELCAPLLARAGAPWLGVTDAEEGVRVRNSLTTAGMPLTCQPEVLVMCGPAPEDADAIVHHHLTPVVWDPAQMEELNRAASATPAQLSVHLEVDTGMSRQGLAAGSAFNRTLEVLGKCRHLQLTGVLTHLASAEVSGAAQTREQLAEFSHLLTAVARHRFRPRWLHVGNTSAIDNAKLTSEPSDPVTPMAWLREFADRFGARPMLRSGLALYGHALPLDSLTDSRLHPHLHPVLTWKTRIRSLTDVPAGAAIGYNATFRAARPMRLALIPVGYADGLRRELSATNTRPGGWTLVHGQRAPIVGRVSMNLTTIDVTCIPEARIGEEVTLLGPGITAADHAQIAGTIPYEILCGIRPTVRRLVAPLTSEPTFAPVTTAPVPSI